MTRSLIASLALALAAACVSSCARQEILEAPITSAKAPVVMACPLGVPHTQVELVETPTGADLSFTTNEQRAPELRARVQEQAVRGPGQRAGDGHLGKHGQAHDHGLRRWDLPAHEVRAVDMPLGGVLQISAVDPARREELLRQLKARIALFDARSCW